MSGGLGRLTATSFVMAFLDAMGAVPEWRSGGATHPGGLDDWTG